MTGTTILEQVKKLVELQKIDAQVYEYKRQLRDKPVLLAALQEQFDNKKAGLKSQEEKFKVIQVSRNSLEVDLKSKEEAIAKFNAQLSLLKTNKEYTAKLSEIESIKADKSIIEEKILLSYDEADAIKSEIEKEKTALSVLEKDYLAQKKIIEDSIREIEAKAKGLEGQRQHIIPEIDKSTLSRYERILVNKDGLAIVPVEGNSCGGCFMNVPAQVVNTIKMHEKFILCEMCARILYLKEDV